MTDNTLTRTQLELALKAAIKEFETASGCPMSQVASLAFRTGFMFGAIWGHQHACESARRIVTESE